MMCNINHFYPNRQYLKQNIITQKKHSRERIKFPPLLIMLGLDPFENKRILKFLYHHHTQLHLR